VDVFMAEVAHVADDHRRLAAFARAMLVDPRTCKHVGDHFLGNKARIGIVPLSAEIRGAARINALDLRRAARGKRDAGGGNDGKCAGLFKSHDHFSSVKRSNSVSPCCAKWFCSPSCIWLADPTMRFTRSRSSSAWL